MSTSFHTCSRNSSCSPIPSPRSLSTNEARNEILDRVHFKLPKMYPETNPEGLPKYSQELALSIPSKRMLKKYKALLPLLAVPDQLNCLRLMETVKYIETYRQKLLEEHWRENNHFLYIHPKKFITDEKKEEISPFHIMVSFRRKKKSIYILPKDKIVGKGVDKTVWLAIDYFKRKQVCSSSILSNTFDEHNDAIEEIKFQKLFRLNRGYSESYTGNSFKIRTINPYANMGDFYNFLTPEGHQEFINTFSTSEQEEILHKILKFIAKVHKKEIVIADVKPENILLKRDGKQIRVFITDFGLSYYETDQKAVRFAGTPYFLGPEYPEGNESKISKKADIFALGKTLWGIFIGGEPPWCINLDIKGCLIKPTQYREHWNKSPFINDDPTKYLESIIHSMMNPDPELRPGIEQLLEYHPTLNFCSPTYNGLRLLTSEESDNRFKLVKDYKTYPLKKCYALVAEKDEKENISYYIEILGDDEQTKRRATFVPMGEKQVQVYVNDKKTYIYPTLETLLQELELKHCLNFFID